MAPMRRFRRPFTMRQTPANHSRSFANSTESGLSVCSVVSEYGMLYCRRLLHADILPQKLSRRCVMPIFAGVSGVACTSTGTPNRASRRASTIPRSSPKFGRVTITPSMASRFRRNRSAQRATSARVVTAPHLVSSAPTAMAPYPPFSSTERISARPLSARWSGKKPRFPTITPNVVRRGFPLFIDDSLSSARTA